MGTRQTLIVLDAHGHAAPATRLLASWPKRLSRAGPHTITSETRSAAANFIVIARVAGCLECEPAFNGTRAKWCTIASPCDRRYSA